MGRKGKVAGRRWVAGAAAAATLLAVSLAGCARVPPATSPTTRTLPATASTAPSPSPTSAPTSPAIPALPAWLAGRDLTVLPTDERVVALTFDAGANADGVASILRTLAEAGVRATFFLTGRWVERYPQEAAAIASVHAIGNHTYDHPDLTALSDRAVRREIADGATSIRAATGRDPRPLFRFPFGASSPHLVGIANSLGYGCVRWTVDTLGWKGTSAGTAEDIVARVLGALRPGAIVIMHVGSNPDDDSTLDADALPRLIEALQARGYAFTALDRCTASPGA